jgi:hypothetical protein
MSYRAIRPQRIKKEEPDQDNNTQNTRLITPQRLRHLNIRDNKLYPIILASLSCVAWERFWIENLRVWNSSQGLRLDFVAARRADRPEARFRTVIPTVSLHHSLNWPELEQYITKVDNSDNDGSKGNHLIRGTLSVSTIRIRPGCFMRAEIRYNLKKIWGLESIRISTPDSYTNYDIPCRNH